MIQYGLIHNCDVTIQDVDNANELFGRDIYALKGKTVRKKPDEVTEDYIAIPKSIAKRHLELTLSIDLMFIQKQIFLVTVSQHLKFTTINHVEKRMTGQVMTELRKVLSLYCHRGFKVTNMHSD